MNSFSSKNRRLITTDSGFVKVMSEVSSRGMKALTGAQVNPRRLWIVAGVTVLLLVFAIQLALTSHANTITWDEPDHIYSGYRSWEWRFRLESRASATD